MFDFIVLEGTDTAGKSALAKRLSEKLGAELFHFGPPTGDASEHFAPVFESVLNGNEVVCDRFILGERIYASVKGTESKWRPGAYDDALSMMNELRATLIIVHEDEETLRRRHAELGETFVTPDEMIEVQRLFLEEAQRIALTHPKITVLLYQPTKNLMTPLGL